jgi:hypothetical protein
MMAARTTFAGVSPFAHLIAEPTKKKTTMNTAAPDAKPTQVNKPVKTVGKGPHAFDISKVKVLKQAEMPRRGTATESTWDPLFSLVPNPGMAAEFPIAAREAVAQHGQKLNKIEGYAKWRVRPLSPEVACLYHLAKPAK